MSCNKVRKCKITKILNSEENLIGKSIITCPNQMAKHIKNEWTRTVIFLTRYRHFQRKWWIKPGFKALNLSLWLLLYHSSCMCVLHFSVVFLWCRTFPLIFDVFPSVLVCNPNLFFFLNPFMNFEQRYTTVVFIYSYLCFCCLVGTLTCSVSYKSCQIQLA